MSKNDQPVYMVRKGHSLVPQLDMDVEKIAPIPEGGVVKVDIHRERSNPRLRAYWKTLSECVKATGCAPHQNALHKSVLMGTGHTDEVKLDGGIIVHVPSSVAFDNMKDEDEMVAYFEAAKEYLARAHGFSGE